MEFDIIVAENISGNMTSHLIARDRKTHSFFYPSEETEDSGEWNAKESEFFSRIYLFVRHCLQIALYEGGKTSSDKKGSLLKFIAAREYKRLRRASAD